MTFNRAHLAVFVLLTALLLSSQKEIDDGDGGLRATFQSACHYSSKPPTCGAQATPDSAPGSSRPSPAPPLQLEANLGQSDLRYSHLGRGRGFFAFLRGDEAALDVRSGVLRAQLVGARAGVGEGLDAGFGRLNYLFGNDPEKWVTDVPTYSRVRFAEVYPGIDLIYYDRDGELEHDFVLRPGANPRHIRLRFSGADGMRKSKDGHLVFDIGGKSLRWSAPVLYQGKQKIEGSYEVLPGGEIGFAVGKYDARQPLVIDPVISMLGYLGRADTEMAGRSAVDAQGNLYLVGASSEGTYPTTPGALPPTGKFQLSNAVVTKMSADGKQLIYSTYFGGGDDEMVAGVAIDAQGNAYMTGVTNSPDFPTTAGSLRRTVPGQRQFGSAPVETGDVANCFITKLNATGNALAYSTYLGGLGADGCTAIAVDTAGNAYVTGGSASADFPTTADVFQPRYRLAAGTPAYDAFVAKLNPAGSALVFSTFIGGTGADVGMGIAIDATGVYVSGVTNSATSWPVTQGAARAAFGGQGGSAKLYPVGDGFALKLRPDGTGLIYNTFLGGSRDDAAFGITVDAQGNAYVVGNTLSTDFPVTASAAQRTWKGAGGETYLPSGDAFVTKINPAGTQFVYSTLLGGARDDRAISVALGADGSAWVVGNTLSTDFPVTPDATQAQNRTVQETGYISVGDGFVSQISADGSRVQYGSYLGGKSGDFLTGVSVLANGAVIVSGTTGSSDLAVTGDTFQRQFFGQQEADHTPLGDLFFARFNETVTQTVTVAGVVNAASYAGGGVSPGMIVTLAGTGIGPDALAGAALANGALVTTVGETRVLFDGVAAPIIYVSARQSSVVVPYTVAGKTSTQMVVEYKTGRSVPLTLPVVAAAPGLFAANASGAGPGAFLNQDGSLNTAANPAVRGDVVILYGTGEGQTNPPGQDGRLVGLPLPIPTAPVEVTIGGIRAEVLYAGGAPGLTAGLLQLNVKVPEGAPSGAQPVVVRVGTADSQRSMTVAIQ